jgi:hypothetical protein
LATKIDRERPINFNKKPRYLFWRELFLFINYTCLRSNLHMPGRSGAVLEGDIRKA